MGDDMNFLVPQSFNTGVLDRDVPFGMLKGVPPYREAHPILPESEWLERIRDPNRASGSELVWSIYNQGSVGSCASEACNGGVKIIECGNGRTRIEYNPYGMYGRVNGGRDGGSSLTANVAFAKKYGCFTEATWPRSKGWRAKPTEAAYAEAYKHRLDESYDIGGDFYAEFFSALLMQPNPHVYFGYPGHAITATDIVEQANAPQEAHDCADIIDRYLLKVELIPTLSEQPMGLVNSLYIKYLNSWGNWGDNGFGYLRASRVQQSYGAFVFLSTTI